MQSFYIAVSSVSCGEFACLMDRICGKLLSTSADDICHTSEQYLISIWAFSSPRIHTSYIRVHEIQMSSESSKKILWHKVCVELAGELFTILFQIMHLIQCSWFLNAASSKRYLKNPNNLRHVLAKEQINSAIPEVVK